MSSGVSKSTSLTLTAALSALGAALAYLIISYFLVGFKSDQLVLAGIFCCAFFASTITRKFILGFSIFIVYWIIFDYMKAFPNYNYNPVHIAGLYNLEKHWFGLHIGGKILTPNEYWSIYGFTFLDIITGIFYLCWIPVPLAFASYMFFVNRDQFLRFSLTFVFVNLLGFIVYYAYPAAPPWYVQYHGFHFIKLTAGNTAGLARFDRHLHAGIFKSIYAKGSNVFAAMPSLHSSYPVIVLYYGLKNRLGWINLFFATVMIGIWFSAVYNSHHYLLDVIAGVICAITGIVLFNYMCKSSVIKQSLYRYEALIR
ncbi:inositol phosphorylceramide synthase [Mucilaginibacter robiniae]|uniref:Inositol phosphorylceramide synthase n=1 Tax=Mucilaginibacter robiniae TaxID=2728022 RepID=A0A7L5EBM1_9SPHI|nr:phosphatase PAP2 family protein [Mucilaginibacter robiniae]QJD97806.1 inositol phosphorylceramide synthase [Mucilaginibacter robiniae]